MECSKPHLLTRTGLSQQQHFTRKIWLQAAFGMTVLFGRAQEKVYGEYQNVSNSQNCFSLYNAHKDSSKEMRIFFHYQLLRLSELTCLLGKTILTLLVP